MTAQKKQSPPKAEAPIAVPAPVHPAVSSLVPQKKFLSSMSIYPLEMAIAMITMVILASMLSWGLFSLCKYFYDQSNVSLGYFSLWMAASAIVWLPVAFIFYVRSRGYMNVHPEVVNSPVQRTFVIIYQVVMILTIIGFSFTAIYAFLTGIVQTSDMGKTLIGMALPAALSAAIFGGAFIAFFRNPVTSRKVYGLTMLVISLLIVLPVIIYSIIALRSVNVDGNRVDDLQSLRDATRDYYAKNDKLPESLDVIVREENVKLKNAQSEYKYTKKEKANYELCTNFVSNTTDNSSRSHRSIYGDDFSQHGTGEQCFKQTAGYYSNYNYKYDF